MAKKTAAKKKTKKTAKKIQPTPRKRRPQDLTRYSLRGIRNDITEVEQRLTAVEAKQGTMADDIAAGAIKSVEPAVIAGLAADVKRLLG